MTLASSVLIRPATSADAERLALVHVRSWQDAYRGLLPQDYLDALAPEQRVELWHRTLGWSDWPRRGVLVAEDDEVLGFAYLGPSRDAAPVFVGEIRSIYVLPARWGAGVGRRLTTAALASLRSAGCTEAQLWVLDTNARAIRFYESAGWRTDGATKAAEIGGAQITEVRYRFELGPAPEPAGPPT